MSDTSERSLASRLFGWARRGDTPEDGVRRDAGPAVATKVLGKFLSALSSREAPAVLDLGPVVGSNVSFLGEHLSCRLRVEDLLSDVDRLTKSGETETLPAFLEQRFPYEPGQFDAVLCWDVLDYLERPAATVLARQIVEWVKPGGAVLCVFNMVLDTAPVHTRYVIADVDHLHYRRSASSSPRRVVYQNRDIERLFTGLYVSESFLLQNKVREVLLRKKAATPPARATAATTTAPTPAITFATDRPSTTPSS